MRQFKKVLHRSLRSHYMPPEYEHRWGRPTLSALYPLLSPYRKARDRRLVKHHLRHSDVFLVGHPKSGNTWVAYMLGILIHQDFNNALNLANVGDYVPVIHGKDYEIYRYPDLKNPRVFRNEWPIYPDLYPRVIYLVRDPRSVLVSYYHMYGLLTGDGKLSLHEFVREYLARGCLIRLEPNIRWDIQVRYWADRANRNDTILIRYEDMLLQRQAALERTVSFMGLPYTSDLIRLALGRGEFKAMKKNEREHGAESYLRVNGRKGAFIRRGKIDSWKDEMEPKTVRLVERELGSVMALLGYEPTKN